MEITGSYGHGGVTKVTDACAGRAGLVRRAAAGIRS